MFQVKVPLASLVLDDPKMQIRDRLDERKVAEYAEFFDFLPPITVYEVDGKLYVVDGYHRIEAAKRCQHEEIWACVYRGVSYEDVLWNAGVENASHGITLKPKEKCRIVENRLRLHPECSNNWIAENLGVTDNYVERVRREMEGKGRLEEQDHLVGQDGRWQPRYKETLAGQIKRAIKDNPEGIDVGIAEE